MKLRSLVMNLEASLCHLPQAAQSAFCEQSVHLIISNYVNFFQEKAKKADDLNKMKQQMGRQTLQLSRSSNPLSQWAEQCTHVQGADRNET